MANLAVKTVPGAWTFDALLDAIGRDFPELSFVSGDAYCWSPATRQVFYCQGDDPETDLYSLLHEVGHGALQHAHYGLDFELVQLEVAAWQKARILAECYGIHINDDHIQDCLDTYRDWLYGRSVCPTCQTKSLQQDDQPMYECFNCHATWRVSPRRFCRPYRLTAPGAQL
jgi:hypothetical protein